MIRGSLAALLLLAGCGGYQFEGAGSTAELTSVSIPYIKGDGEGMLNTEIAKALSISGVFDYVQNAGSLVLEASIVADGDERIGYRYDRNATTGERRDNIVGTENRRELAVEIKLVDSHSGAIVLGPEVIRATTEYDYVDGNSIRDLVFIENGTPQTVLNFSLGQLDSVNGAHDDASASIYQIVAQKITQRLLLQRLRVDKHK